MTNNKQPLPIGVDDFKEIRDNNYCYVDKTPLISEILGGRSKVILFTRPRRFGKTLNLSMMQHFLDCDAPNSLPLFKGLKIEKEENGRFLKYMNKYPVFFITLKTLDFNNFESFLKKLNLILSRQFEKYRYLLQSKKLSQDQKDFFQRIVSKNANKEDLQSSLQFICDVLALHHEQKTFLLIDEYDAPIHSAFNNKKYNECIEFMRGFYSDALKTNINLNKAVMTGILRVAKESIFSGLNNLDVLTVTSPNCAHYFGLTEIEIKQLLVNFELEQEFENVKKWYNGYQFGLNSSLYNPWSIINWLKNSAHQFISYWVNTSSNDLIRSLFFEHSNILEESIEKLLCSESIQIELQENLHFPTLQTKCSENDYFTLLLNSGYLTLQKNSTVEDNYACLVIPNKEIQSIFRQMMAEWFKQLTPNLINNLPLVISTALKTGDLKTFETHFTNVVIQVMSFHDFAKQPENAFHCFTAGFLSWLSHEYEIKSNRETGLGRADIYLMPLNTKLPGYIFEFKAYKPSVKKKKIHPATLTKQLNLALAQIEEKNYAAEFKARKIKNITKVAMLFYGKNVWFKTVPTN